ncbi:MAG: hypothetical protein IJ125_04500 [Atopobiaceae bacterium]|nr:hypothetical protein [Atopobiaceae bacterium]
MARTPFKNPLFKRLPREFKNNLGKYLGMFLMFVFATAFTSGFLLSASSIEKIIDEMPGKYAIEDGRFSCDFEPSTEALDAVKACGVSLTEDFYCELPLILSTSSSHGGDVVNADETTNTQDTASTSNTQGTESPASEANSASAQSTTDITVRIYPPRLSVNLPEYAAGRAPQSPSEIALDRVFMVENHGLDIGDTVSINNRDFTICGIITFPDYQALFADNAAFMFDALSFCVATVSDEGYQALRTSHETFNYSFTFNDKKLSLAERTTIEEDMIDALSTHNATLNTFIDAADNQGIGYAITDVQGDQTMWTVLLFVLILIMAFVFVVLTNATIEAESSVIGTMLASGWRKSEIIVHYMVLPLAVGFVGVSIGLVIGVVGLTDTMRGLYYHSYSLPPYRTIWDWKIVFITTVVPFLLLSAITLIGLVRKMHFTPLQFLRHEASTKKRNAAMSLPEKLSYPVRFRLRVLLRNASHFVTLFFGIMFASLLLLFGSCMLPVVQNYTAELMKTVAAPHHYVLKIPVELNGTDDEREMYAAALRVIEDRDRYNDNKAAIDAAERLEDNLSLMDALERLQDNNELMDALERLQNNTELSDALERIQNNSELTDALGRLQQNDDVLDAIQRLQEDRELMDAVERLEDRPELLDAAERLSAQSELMRWVSWAQANPLHVAAATRVAAGSTDPTDLAYASALSAEERAGLQLLSTIDAQTQADMELMQSIDEQTRADLDLMSSLDEQTQADLDLIQNVDEQTRADIELFQDVDEQTRADLDILTKLDEQAEADIDLLIHLDETTQADVDTLRDVDDTTQADIDLIREMDQDLLDDLRLAADIDEDAHVINSQPNDPQAIEHAEKYAVASLEIERAMGSKMESITVYGIQPNSRYWTDIPVADGHVVAGRGLVEKTKADIGSSVEAHNVRTGDNYHIEIAECASNESDTNLYMSLSDFNALFDNDTDYFNGYACESELVLDSRYTAQHIQPSDMLKMSNQLETSMGKIMYMMMAMAVPIYLILVYLLTKTVIDRSARSIAYMKVFGYHTKEVDGLYIRPITYWVLLSLVVSLPLIVFLLTSLLIIVFMNYSGNFPIIIPPNRYVALVVVGMIAYAVVAFLHVRHIKAVPLELAMKVQE